MPEVEGVARLLMIFADQAQRHADDTGFQTGQRELGSHPEKAAIRQMFERCVGLLDEAEREALQALVRKMMPATQPGTPIGGS